MTFNKLTPNFEVKNIRQTVNFYESVLGFSIVMAVPVTQDGVDQTIMDGKEYAFAIMTKDKVELMFQTTESFKEDIKLAEGISIGASVSFYMEVSGLDNMYNEMKSKVSDVSEPNVTWYGMKEFHIKDINGYILIFAEKV